MERWYGHAPMASISRSLRPLAAGCAAAVAVALAAACGSSSGDPGADPAAVVPSRAPLYAEANLSPDDGSVDKLAQKLAGTGDPGGELKRLIERQAREDDPDFSFEEDVDPWLGDRIGVFVSRVTARGADPDAAIVFTTKDTDEARDSLEGELRRGGKGDPQPKVSERSYRDTKYLVDTADDDAVAIIDDYAVSGTEAAVKSAIDAREGESAAQNDAFGKARDAVEDKGLGFAYVQIAQVFSALGPQGAAARQALAGLGDTVALGLDASDDSIRFESAALGVDRSAAGATGPGDVFEDLPATSWLAGGAADVGASIRRAIDRIGQLGAFAGVDANQLLRQVERQTGVNPRRDLADWMGDVGVFVSGDTPAEVGGALVAESKDKAATRRAIPRIARLLRTQFGMSVQPLDRSGVDAGVTLRAPQLPLPIHMALAGDRFVLAVTDRALDQALASGGRLGESQSFRSAKTSLGGGFEPSLFMAFAPIARLVESSGAARDKDGEKVLRALRSLTTASAGGKREGETQRGKLVIGVR